MSRVKALHDPSGPKLEPTIAGLDQTSELAQILARRGGLSEDDIKRIAADQEQRGLGFIEAALRLDLITQADLDTVLAGEMQAEKSEAAVARPSGELQTAQDPFEPFSESIRALRTELIQRTEENECNMVAILSPSAAEGRTRLACELAIACAQLGQATLLVDADLRRSRMHDYFSADNDDGLAQALLEGRAPKVQSVVGLASLSLLTAGPKSSAPIEILSDPIFGEMLKGWKRRYRHVILDTPPASEFSDALAVATEAGRVLMVTRKDHTSISATRDLIKRIEVGRAHILGCVLNTF